MKVIVHGSTGHMGRIVAELADKGFGGFDGTVRVGRSHEDNPSANIYSSLENYQGEAAVVVDFSNHSGTQQLLDYCVKRGLPVVVATTGHTQEEKAAISAAAEKIPVFASGNMSVGIAVLCDLARRAAVMFPDADIEIVEKHHNRKLDVPSGTALMLADSIKQARPEAEYLIGRHENGKRTKKEIGIHSIRMGNEVGTHEIYITTGNETLTLKHESENRALFAEGALTAAAFLKDQPAGLYNMKDILG